MTRKLQILGIFFAVMLIAVACEAPDTNGTGDQAQQPAAAASKDGPDSIDQGGIEEVSDDPDLIAKGEELYRSQACVACHAFGRDGAGPDLSGVTDRRTAPWLARMIMSPQEMVAQDPVAKEVADRFPAPMSPTNITPEQVEAIIAYLGTQ